MNRKQLIAELTKLGVAVHGDKVRKTDIAALLAATGNFKAVALPDINGYGFLNTLMDIKKYVSAGLVKSTTVSSTKSYQLVKLRSVFARMGITVKDGMVKKSDIVAALKKVTASPYKGSLDTYGEFWRDGGKIWMHADAGDMDVTKLFSQPDEMDMIPSLEDDTVEMDIEIEFSATPGSSGGRDRDGVPYEGDPGEVEYTKITLILPNNKKMPFDGVLDIKTAKGGHLSEYWDEKAIEDAEDYAKNAYDDSDRDDDR